MLKLLYVWINENDSGFIAQKGFPFSVEHRFAVSVERGGFPDEPGRETYTLKYEYHPEAMDPWHVQDGSKHGGQIAGLTALVGKNGSGKTSVLRYLHSLIPENYYSPDENRGYRRSWSGYAAYQEEKSRKERRLFAYDIDGAVHIFHTFPEELFSFPQSVLASGSDEPDIFVHALYSLPAEERISTLYLLDEQTTIYFSNSLYTPELRNDWDEDPVSRLSLTPGFMTYAARRFYAEISWLHIARYTGLFSTFQTALCDGLGIREFQQLCDVCYYHFQNRRVAEAQTGEPSAHTEYIGKRSRELTITFSHAYKTLLKNKERGNALYDSEETNESWLSDMLREQLRKADQFGRQWGDAPFRIQTDAFCTLCGSVLLELCCVCDLALPEAQPDGPEEYLDILADKYREYCRLYEERQEGIRHLASSLRYMNEGDYREYYRLGLDEVKTLRRILAPARERKNTVPREDPDYKIGYTLSYNAERPYSAENDRYRAFCEAVSRFASAPCSIVLKYIRIEEPFSSGERALQNMFSWLHWVMRMHPYRYIPLRKNILLMIDEIDLYMHPEWQRSTLQTLLRELAAQYGGETIQLLISTHSPLVLSDVPLQNTIYLRQSGDKLELADRGIMPQTFGANIHSLLNNSFFLSNTLGAFAYQTIEKVSHDLQHLRAAQARLRKRENRESSHLDAEYQRLTERCRSYRGLIESIGEPLLRRQLLLLYAQCFPDAAGQSETGSLQRVRAELLSLLEQNDLPPEVRDRLLQMLDRLRETRRETQL